MWQYENLNRKKKNIYIYIYLKQSLIRDIKNISLDSYKKSYSEIIIPH